MSILNITFKILINVFNYIGNIAGQLGCGGMMDEPEIPQELIDLEDK